MRPPRLSGSYFLLRFALEPQSPQLLSAVTNFLQSRVIVRSCFWSFSSLLLTRFEYPLSAGAIYVFMLEHAD